MDDKKDDVVIRLLRVEYGDDCVRGVLVIRGVASCVTLERPWEDNRRNISCIPAGEYEIRRVQSPRFGDTFEVVNVPGRSHILFHAGNRAKDSRGCILLGSGFGQNGTIVNSRAAVRRVLGILKPCDSARLLICDVA